MSANNWHLTFFYVLLIHVAVYALPTTSSPSTGISQSPSSGNARRKNLQAQYVFLGGNKYVATPIDAMDQGHFSDTYKIVDGFLVDKVRRVPAILKQVSERVSADGYYKTREEIRFLKKQSVDLHLFSKWERTKDGYMAFDLVVKDVGADIPPFKPFYKWYLEDESINACSGLSNVRKNVLNRLTWYAENENLIYEDNHPRNIHLRKRAISEVQSYQDVDHDVLVMPIDWGPKDKYSGVVDLSNTHEDYRRLVIKDYKDKLSNALDLQFNVEELAYELGRHGDVPRDEDFLTIGYKDETYELLHIKTGDNRETYKVVERFNGKRALLDIVTTYTEREGLQEIEDFRQKNNVLGTKMTRTECDIFYEDTRIQLLAGTGPGTYNDW